ncbi:fungal-specific transcription factor domain-containing protein [Neurospora crassa]|nr:fungal-specific transcription factor domain-containing protein [Neurospora crassa]
MQVKRTDKVMVDQRNTISSDASTSTGAVTEAARARQTRPASQPSNPSGTSTSTNGVSLSAGGSRNSPEMYEDDSLELSQHDHASPSESVKSSAHGPLKSESEDTPGDATGHASSEPPTLPVQKRRRVTRACDECRRKKIKCDGKQPCSHCSIYSYDCTYDKPSNRRRNPAPQYIEALESRLQRAESLLRKFVPDIDLADPNLDPAIQQEFRAREQARARAAKLKGEAAPKEPEAQDAQIMSMIDAIGQLDMKEDGECDFRGISSGAVFFGRMKEHFKGLLSNEHSIPFLFRKAEKTGLFSLNSPQTTAGSPWEASSVPNVYELPPLTKVQTLCYYAFSCATCLLRVVHKPTFYESLDRLYEKPQDSWGIEEHRFLGLLYAVMALGTMYNIDENPGNPTTHQAAMEEGIKYYTSARLLLQDIAECRDMTSLQGLVFMILFLQASSNMSACYAFLGIALRSCIRMGLHRHLRHARLTPIEEQTRRRVFHVVRQIDIYVSAILGFPVLLHADDIDQPLPTEVDDKYITKDAILTPDPDERPSFLQAFNAHHRLMGILARLIKFIYPVKGVEDCALKSDNEMATYTISYARIKEIERQLHEWFDQLPRYWRPGPDDDDIEVIRVRTLLRFAYGHVQMMLYRPFLHYVSARMTAGKRIDDRYYNCAAAGISVSRNIVHIGLEIQKQAHLIGPYWFLLYTQFFAILSLVYYVLENPDKTGSAEILADAKAGRDVIANLTQRSLAADRVTTALNTLFDQLPEQLKNGSHRPAPTKKRSYAPGSKAGSNSISSHAQAILHDTLPQRRSDEIVRPQSGPVRRETHHRHPQRTTSFDTVALHQPGMPGHHFATQVTAFQDLLPLDMSSMTGSDTSSNPGAPPVMHRQQHHRQQSGFQQAQTPTTGALYKLDAMMFPSGDPFAYPTPLLDQTGGGGHHAVSGQPPPPISAGSVGPTPGGGGPDNMQLYMSGFYDDGSIEGQVLGPVAPYLMQHGGPEPPHAGVLDPAAQMSYTTMLNLQLQHQQRQQQQQQHGQDGRPGSGPGRGQQQHPSMHQRHANQSHQHQHPGLHQQQRHQQSDMMEGIFRGEWEDILGSGGAPPGAGGYR